MSPTLLFSLANSYVLIGWLCLIVIPFKPYTDKLIIFGVIAILGLLYMYLLSGSMADFDISVFSSLEGIKGLFKNDAALTAGWVHYLAFDLLAGKYISDKGRELNIPRWQILLCLPFTFLFGPVGFVLFSIIRLINK
jgi:hypothetical protein